MKALVISLRGFHLGYAGCFGNEWISTPALDRLAAAGVVFDQHLADVPEAEAARRGWRSGRHQLPALGPDTPTAAATANSPDLLDELHRGGVRAVLIVDGSGPFPADFARGWDRVEVVRALSGEATFLEQTLEAARLALEELASAEQWLLWVDLATLLPPWQVPAEFSDPYFQEADDLEDGAGEESLVESDEVEETDEEAAEAPEEEVVEEEVVEEQEEPIEEEWLDEETEDGDGETEAGVGSDVEEQEEEDEEPLTPWFDPAPGFINTEDDIDFARLQSSYAAAVSFVDAGVDTLLGELERLGLGESCLVLLTSDHGQALGEHGVVGPHRPWLHDELIHLPLLLRLPPSLALDVGREEVKGSRVSALTQSVDVMPTLLESFGLPVPAGVQGRSLLPLARGDPGTAGVREYACCGLRLGGVGEWCLRTPEWAFVLPDDPEAGDSPRGPQLYVKPDDRWEVNNVLQHRLELAEQYEATLKAFVAAAHLSLPGTDLPRLRKDGSGVSG
jgi:arylsulfatase A-like enzyme